MITPGRDHRSPPTAGGPEFGSPAERALDLAGLAYVVIDRDCRVTDSSRSAAEILALDLESLDGHLLTDLVPAGDRPWIEEYCRMVENRWAGPTPRVIEVPAEGGGERGIGISAHIAKEENGEPRLMILLRTLRSESEQRAHISRRARMLQRFNELFMDLTRHRALDSSEPERIFTAITEAAADLIGVERVGVWLYDEDRTLIRCGDLYERTSGAHFSGNELVGKDYPIYFAALEENRTITADDARLDPRTAEFRDSYLRERGITSMLDAPIRLERRAVGVLCHEHVGPARHWTAEDEVVAGSMADLVAMALQAGERRRALASLARSEQRLREERDRIGAAIAGPLETLSEAIEEVAGLGSGEFEGPGHERLAEAARAVRTLQDFIADGERGTDGKHGRSEKR